MNLLIRSIFRNVVYKLFLIVNLLSRASNYTAVRDARSRPLATTTFFMPLYPRDANGTNGILSDPNGSHASRNCRHKIDLRKTTTRKKYVLLIATAALLCGSCMLPRNRNKLLSEFMAIFFPFKTSDLFNVCRCHESLGSNSWGAVAFDHVPLCCYFS